MRQSLRFVARHERILAFLVRGFYLMRRTGSSLSHSYATIRAGLAGLVVLCACTAAPPRQPLRDRDLALYLAWLIDEHTVHAIVSDTLHPGDTLLRRLVSRGLPHLASLEMIESSRGIDYLCQVW